MSKYVINESTLTAIGDAIRAKGNTEDKILVSDLATAITNLPTGGGAGGDVEPIVLTGDCSFGCGGTLATKYIELYGDTITTNNITLAECMFKGSTLTKIPFDLNFDSNSSSEKQGLFESCSYLTEIPKMNYLYSGNIRSMFSYCRRLRELPEDFGSNWKFTSIINLAYFFEHCYSLRRVPALFLSKLRTSSTGSSSQPYNTTFNYCYALDEVINMPVCTNSYTANRFSGTFTQCQRLKDFTFETYEDGTPIVASWKSQTLDLSSYVGYSNAKSNILDYNSGITADKEVTDDATYQALKNDNDWFTCDINYSRYNHDSAVNTINSLPDCSATGTNTIKFKGASGALTDGGAINTLTEEEIAVAAAKGWTVSLV